MEPDITEEEYDALVTFIALVEAFNRVAASPTVSLPIFGGATLLADELLRALWPRIAHRAGEAAHGFRRSIASTAVSIRRVQHIDEVH